MSTRVVDRVDSWADRPFEDGYRTLQELTDRGFSGVVRAGGAELYLTKGTVVGIQQGRIEDVEGATGTIYEAPTPALPLLAIMQDRSDEVRAKYYTEDTSISTVDQKLSDGNFTGYIELSENVLSGDYYIVYHQGHSMGVAFVGESSRLIDGDEAFEQADGEVGIYEVKPVDIEPTDIPEPTSPPPQSDEADEVDEERSAEPESPTEPGSAKQDSEPDAPEATTEDTPTDGEDAPDTAATEESQPAGDDSEDSAVGNSRTDTGSKREAESERPGDTTTPADETGPAGTQSGGGGTQRRPEEPATEGTDSRSKKLAGTDPTGTRRDTTDSGRTRRDSAARDAEGSGATLETRSIPSLDPARTEAGKSTPDTGSGTDATNRRDTGQTPPQTESRTQADSRPQTESRPQGDSQSADRNRGREQSSPQASVEESETTEAEQSTERPATESAESEAESKSVDPDRVEELESELEERESKLEEVQSRLDSVSQERDNLEADLQSVREERDELAEEVERLEAEIDRLESEFGAATDAERRITPREALDGTDIFVRYHSKGDATLSKAHDGSIRRSDLEDNLRLEKHTQFDAASVAVGGQTFDEFLEERLEFQFVEWVIHDLLFEIRDTGHSSGLADLFDAIPKVDRAELNAVVEVVYSEDGQETRTTESFDVVLRDRMGDPLVVANLNDSREAATEGDMEGLVTAAERVGQTAGDFAAAFFVTRSFFEPGALETASEATRGGLLSRDKRESFVNLSRKRGYHLCLVEARNNNFHLAVPEL